MTGNFCRRTARKIRQLGYAPEHATWFTRFFFVSILAVFSAAGALNVPIEGAKGWITSSGKCPADTRAGRISPAFIHPGRY